MLYLLNSIRSLSLFIFAVLILASESNAQSFQSSTFVSGLSGPTAMAFSPDGRIFVTEKNGKVRVVKNGQLLSTPFISLTVSPDGERGLLGIAFDPAFSTNRYIYLYYTTTTPNNRVSRFQASSTNPDVAESGSETVILDNIPCLWNNHNGGALHFGTDGKLYIAVGDNTVRTLSLKTRLPLPERFLELTQMVVFHPIIHMWEFLGHVPKFGHGALEILLPLQ